MLDDGRHLAGVMPAADLGGHQGKASGGEKIEIVSVKVSTDEGSGFVGHPDHALRQALRRAQGSAQGRPLLPPVPFGADVVPEADVGPGADGVAGGDHGAFRQVWSGDAAGGQGSVGQALETDELEATAKSKVNPAMAEQAGDLVHHPGMVGDDVVHVGGEDTSEERPFDRLRCEQSNAPCRRQAQLTLFHLCSPASCPHRVGTLPLCVGHLYRPEARVAPLA